jgi:hypothetical protein
MNDIRIKVQQTPSLNAVLNTDPNAVGAQVPGVNQSAIRLLSQLEDVDVSQLGDGSLLMYNSTTQRWVATNTLENSNLTISGGNY